MKFDPMPQQVLMEDWLDTHPLAMLWVGCGLGKTAVVLKQIAKLILDGAAKGALVVAPLRVAKITWPAQCERWDHSSWLRIVNLNTPEGVKAWNDGSADIYVTHYDMLATVQRKIKGKAIAYPGHVAKFLKRKTIPADILVVDECFPAGTMVDTPTGRVVIESLKKGDCILNVLGEDSVVQTHKNEVHEAALIRTSDGRSIISSTTHKFFTKRGWVAASETKSTDCILSREATLRLVQRGVCDFLKETESAVLREILCGEISDSGEENTSNPEVPLVRKRFHPKGFSPEKVLRQIMLGEMEAIHIPAEAKPREDQGTYSSTSCLALRRECGSRSREETDYGNVPDEKSRVRRETESHPEKDRPQSNISRGEWKTDASSSEAALRHSRPGVDARVCGEDIGEMGERVPFQLQDRHREPCNENRDRSRRGQSLISSRTTKRREEKLEVGFVRVDSVEILQQGDPRLDQFRDSDGRIYFYDITAAQHPSYAVEGLLVHNCSFAKNPSSKRINALRLHSHHFKYRWGLTGTPIPNSYLDVFAQTRLIDDGERFGRGFEAFRSRYFESDYMGFKYTLRPGAKEQIDEKLKDLALVLRSSDFLKIPDTQVIDEEVALPPAARSAYQKLEKDLLLQLERGEIVALNAASLVAKLMQITTGVVYDAERGVHEIHEAKITALAAIRKRHKSEPILVLTAYQHEQDRLLRAMPDAVKFHEDRIPDWQKGKIKLFVANPGQMSHGIDGLQDGGRIVAWMTPTFSQEKTIQTNARLARTGQGEETIVYRIIAKGTVDEAVMEVLRDKEENQNGAFEALKNLQRLKS